MAMLTASLAKCVSKVPSIYLFRLGTVDALRDQLCIPRRFKDNGIVLKYGRTVDLKRRTGEHVRSYKLRLPMARPQLECCSIVHPAHLVLAEREIDGWFKEEELHLGHAHHLELAIAPRSLLRTEVRKAYVRLSDVYGAH